MPPATMSEMDFKSMLQPSVCDSRLLPCAIHPSTGPHVCGKLWITLTRYSCTIQPFHITSFMISAVALADSLELSTEIRNALNQAKAATDRLRASEDDFKLPPVHGDHTMLFVLKYRYFCRAESVDEQVYRPMTRSQPAVTALQSSAQDNTATTLDDSTDASLNSSSTSVILNTAEQLPSSSAHLKAVESLVITDNTGLSQDFDISALSEALSESITTAKQDQPDITQYHAQKAAEKPPKAQSPSKIPTASRLKPTNAALSTVCI